MRAFVNLRPRRKRRRLWFADPGELLDKRVEEIHYGVPIDDRVMAGQQQRCLFRARFSKQCDPHEGSALGANRFGELMLDCPYDILTCFDV